MFNFAATVFTAATSGTLLIERRFDLSKSRDMKLMIILNVLGIIGLWLGAELAAGLRWKDYSKSAIVIRNLSIGLAVTHLATYRVPVQRVAANRLNLGLVAITRGLMVGTSYHLLRQLLNGEGSGLAMRIVAGAWLVAPSYTAWCCLQE